MTTLKLRYWLSLLSALLISASAYSQSVQYADTANMLVPYLRKTDTANLVGKYLRKSDTTLMLIPYLRKIDTSFMLSRYLRKTDTSFMLSRYLRKTDTSFMLSRYLRKTDTLFMLSPYLRKTDTANLVGKYLRKSDTSQMLNGYLRSGNLPSLSGKMNYTDTLNMLLSYLRKGDTSQMLSGYLRSGNLPSISGKMNYTDTLNMLLGYLRKGDTSQMLSGYLRSGNLPSISGKMNYTDTLDMLLGYLRKGDTSQMLSGYLRLGNLPSISGKMNYTDTLDMLLGYLRKGDTSQMLSGYLRSGNLPSISGKMNYSDTLNMLLGYLRRGDTSQMLSGYLRAGNLPSISGKMNYTDTLNMLLGYMRKGDTSQMLSGYARLGNIPLATSKVNYSDTALMLVPYLRKVDTTVMMSRYLRRTDTAFMISPYLRKTDTAFMMSRYLRRTDTAFMMSRYLRRTDTAFMLSPYLRKLDTALMLSRYLRRADTAIIVAPYLRKSDTSQMLSGYLRSGNLPSISGKMNYTDTLNMLLGYLRKGDTSQMLSGYLRSGNLPSISGKMNYADTLAMLQNYLRKTDTASLVAGYLRKGDTSQMLSGYARLNNLPSTAQKVNYSDTSLMLKNYVRISDTANLVLPYFKISDSSSLVWNYLRKSDTSQMLSSYLRKSDLPISMKRPSSSYGGNYFIGGGGQFVSSYSPGCWWCGTWNVSLGSAALNSLTSGSSNVAIGEAALLNTTTGLENIGIGYHPLFQNITGRSNIAIGRYAGAHTIRGENVDNANYSIYIGDGVRPSASNNTNEIIIGSDGYEGNHGNGSNSVTLGGSSIEKTILRGNIGIGTVSPQYKLDIIGNLRATQDALFSSNVTANSFVKAGGTSAQFLMADGTTSLGGGGTFSGTTNYLPKFTSSAAIGNSRIFDNGTNVGIGTITPAAALDISASANNIRLNATANQQSVIQFGYSGTNNYQFVSDNNNIGNGAPGYPKLILRNESQGVDYITTTNNNSSFFLGDPTGDDYYNLRLSGKGTTYKWGLSGSWYPYMVAPVVAGPVFAVSTPSRAFGGGSNAGIVFDSHWPSLYDYNFNIRALAPTFSVGTLNFNVSTGGTQNTVMSLKGATQNVLIGTQTDNSLDKLQVNGSGRFTSSLTANSFIKLGGTSTQYLMADGSISTLPSFMGGSGTTNYLSKFTSTGAIGNSQIFDNGTSVGINIASPISTNRLQVDGGYISVRGVLGGGGGFYTSHPNTTNASARTWGWGASISSFGDFGINQSNAKDGDPITAGTNRFYIDATGNVGIGTASPNFRLQVLNSGTNSTISVGGVAAGETGRLLLFGSGSKTTWMLGAQQNIDNSFEITPSTAIGGTSFTNPALAISSGGNVGIGYTAPAAKLAVSGTTLINTNTDNGVDKLQVSGSASVSTNIKVGTYLISSYNNEILAGVDAGGYYFANGASGTSNIPIFLGDRASYIGFKTSPSTAAGIEKMRITSSGRILMGATLPTDNGVDALQVSGSVAISSNVSIGGQTGAAGVSVIPSMNYSFGEGSGLSYVNLFRQASTAASVLANGYKYSGTAGGFASSISSAWAKSAIAVGFNNGSISFFADPITTVANGTNITPTERMRITSAGNALIGTITDNGLDKLQVNGSGRFTSSLTANSFIKIGGTSTQYLMADGSVSTLPSYMGGTGSVNYMPKFTTATTIGNSQIFDNGTNLGIGTASPTYKLDVSGSINQYWNGSAFTGTPLAMSISNIAPGGYDPVLLFQQADSYGTIKNSGGIGMVGRGPWTAGDNSAQMSDMYFLVRNNAGSISERMRITSGGNALIGTTTDNGLDKLQVNGSGRFTTSLTANNFIKAGGTSSQYLMADGSVSTLPSYMGGSGTVNYIPKFNSSTGIGNSQIFDNGTNVGIGTTSPSNTAGYSKQLQIEGTYPTLTLKNTTGTPGWFSLGAGSAGDFGIWNNSTNSYPFYLNSSNNIGIGTTTPGAKLDVNGTFRTTGIGANANPVTAGTNQNYLRFLSSGSDFYVGTEGATGGAFFTGSSAYDNVLYSSTAQNFIIGGASRMRITSTGNVGIGSTNPQANLSIKSGSNVDAEINSLPGGISIQSYNRTSSTYGFISFLTNQNNESMRIFNTGQVCIGCVDLIDKYKFAVEGGIAARSLRITQANPWADYVFDKKYQLKPLDEVEKYIQQNHHLPDMPSAATVAEEGIDVADIQSKLLSKIEELTLYVIELKKEVDALKKNQPKKTKTNK